LILLEAGDIPKPISHIDPSPFRIRASVLVPGGTCGDPPSTWQPPQFKEKY
jgi:hypothetical protein